VNHNKAEPPADYCDHWNHCNHRSSHCSSWELTFVTWQFRWRRWWAELNQQPPAWPDQDQGAISRSPALGWL